MQCSKTFLRGPSIVDILYLFWDEYYKQYLFEKRNIQHNIID